MNSYTFFTRSIFTITSMAFLAVVFVPSQTFAASVKPTCSLRVTTPSGETSIKNKEKDISVKEGEQISIVWASKDAKTATDVEGKDIALSGTATYSPDKTTTYSYKFVSGSKKVTCAVTANIVGGTIDASSLSTSSTKPTISGTASGVKSLQVIIKEDGSSKTAFKSKTIKIRNGNWEVKVSKKLSEGTYNVTVSDSKDSSVKIANGVLTVNTGSTNTATSKANNGSKSKTTLAVSLVPLLVGGTAHAGGSVPISYLQVTNTGSESATVKGFSVKQNGSAGEMSIIGLTTVDDKNGSRGSVGGVEGTTPFKNGVAFAPVTDAVILPGQMKLFTIKAVLTKNVTAFIGKQLMIDVVSVDTDATVKATFSIRGTTWTIAK